MKMINNNYYTGFYLNKNQDIKGQLLSIESSKPSEKSSKDNNIYYNCDMFLHGICHVFAYALNQRFGYDIFEIESKSSTMVHWCCILVKDKKNVYIDVRGMTTDFNEFIKEFEPDMGVNPNIRKIDDLNNYSDEWDEEQVTFANEIITKYYDYYLVN